MKHLHLGGQGSDVIVYMAEFETWVELLSIDTHVHLESDPRGKDLRGRFRSAIESSVKMVRQATSRTRTDPGKKP